MTNLKQNLTVSSLAVFGGKPISKTAIHSCRPYADDKEAFLQHLDTAWQARRFTNNGPLVVELEQQLQSYLKVDHCIATNNGTAAMSILMQALGLKQEVILPSFTFISTAHTLHMAGIKPVFCDIDPINWTLDIEHCKQLINDKTSAIIGTHIWGNACNIEELTQLCSDKGIQLIFDAAHALGCTYHGTPIGQFGAAEVFSFHATKVFHTFEGGAITTNSSELAERLRKTRNFGFNDYDHVTLAGTNAKMTEISAAMGLASLSSLEKRVKHCHRAYKRYQELLKGVNGISFYQRNTGEKSNYHYIVAEVSDEFGLNRDELVNVLHAENIVVRRYFYPGSHQSEPYKTLYRTTDNELPITHKIARRVLILPGGADISDEEIDVTCKLIRFIHANADKIATILRKQSS